MLAPSGQSYHPDLHAILLSRSYLPGESRLDGPAQQTPARPSRHSERHAQRPAPALAQNLEVAERLRRLHDAE